MTLGGLTLPRLSAYDPPVVGEGYLDPMGLAAISDRLADRLVPGVRARMQRVRFLTATAVGALACETLADELPADGVSTPAICFEWLVIEAFVRRLPPEPIPAGIPGSQKARSVVGRGGRLSAATYLKGPAVFGFTGVFKPLALDTGVVGPDLEPGARCPEPVRAWEREQDFAGFADGVPATPGGRLRASIRDGVRAALREGRCTANTRGWLLGHLCRALHPERASRAERRTLRRLLASPERETRAELVSLLAGVEAGLTEAELLAAVRPRCSPPLGRVADAVEAYERFAALVDGAFRTLCSMSHSLGSQPLTPRHAAGHEVLVRCARELPGRFRLALERAADIGLDGGLESQLGEFAIPRSVPELAELLVAHHERVQARKPPNGRRPWFEPLRGGWVVRPPYGKPEPRIVGFVHPIRLGALHGFLRDTTA